MLLGTPDNHVESNLGNMNCEFMTFDPEVLCPRIFIRPIITKMGEGLITVLFKTCKACFKKRQGFFTVVILIIHLRDCPTGTTCLPCVELNTLLVTVTSQAEAQVGSRTTTLQPLPMHGPGAVVWVGRGLQIP